MRRSHGSGAANRLGVARGRSDRRWHHRDPARRGTGGSIHLHRPPAGRGAHTERDGSPAADAGPHNGYAILSAASGSGKAYARFLYLPPRLDDLPPGFITTVVGIGLSSGEYGPAKEAFLRQPWSLAFDAEGRLYISDAPANRVWRINDGLLEPFAGVGFSNGAHPPGQTPATDVSIDFPRSIAFDNAGNLIVPDSAYYLWKVTPSGLAELIAGNGQEGTTVAEGIAAKGSSAGFPTYVVVDAEDNIFFIDWAHARVRRIDPAGIVTTVVGTGTYGFSGDGGSATSAQFHLSFNDVGGLAIDSVGNLYVLDHGNRRIRRVAKSTGIIETLVGPTVGEYSLNDLLAMAVTPDGTLYFSNASRIFRRDPTGTITPLSSGRSGLSEDGTLLTEAALGAVKGLAIDSAGNLVFVDNQRVRVADRSSGRITTLAGIGPRALGEGGPATAAALTTQNVDLELLSTGELLVADSDRLYRIGPDAKLMRIAGSGSGGPIEGLPALETNSAFASASARPDGTIDFASGNLGVFRIDINGMTRRTAGSGFTCGLAGDGSSALQALTCQVWDALADGEGNVLFADSNNNRVRRVDEGSGVITTIAGSGPSNGFERYGFGSTCGDGGPATSACINTPYGLAFDDSGNLFVCENQQRIRRITPAGIIGTLADVGCTKLTWAFGNVFTVADDFVARISPDGEVVALTRPDLGFSGDGGPASEARIFAQKQSHGIAVDENGHLYFGDGDNFRVRAIRYGAVLAPPGASVQATANESTVIATVRHANGRPAPGVRVEFDAPSDGASCRLSSTFAVTGADGRASVTCTPNCTPGAYSVGARPLGSASSASASFTNLPRPCRRRIVRH